jgi:ABC-2 type transport system ATP-binding protein
LFLDEPTAGVDVTLRKDMWQIVRDLRSSGVTIILTTHYIDEAEEMADRIGVINKGEMILVEDKATLLHKLGQKKLTIQLAKPLKSIPSKLKIHNLQLTQEGKVLVFNYDTHADKTGIATLMDDLKSAKLAFSDLATTQSSLEDIFVDLVKK